MKKIDEDKFINEAVRKLGLNDFIILKKIILKKHKNEITVKCSIPLARSLT